MERTDGLRENACDAAVAVARLSNHHFRVGAAIVKGRKIISLGCNSNKTTPFIRKKISDKTMVDRMHAEMSCILKAQKDISKCKIYVARLTSNGLGNARPCMLCMSMIQTAGVREVFYSTEDGWKKEKVIRT